MHTYKISAVIDAALMRTQIKRQNEGSEVTPGSSSDSADQTATDATKRRLVSRDKSEADDARENATPEERIQAVTTAYTEVAIF